MKRGISAESAAYFGEDYMRSAKSAALTPKRSEAEMEALSQSLSLSAQESILDLGCGWGRHSLALARRGHRVLGLDQSESFIKAAQLEVEQKGSSAEFLQMDLCELPLQERFDLALCLFGSFGYSEEESDDLEILRGAYRSLKPGGALLLELWNPRQILSSASPLGSSKSAGLRIDEHQRFDPTQGRLHLERSFVEEGAEPRSYRCSIRLYNLPETKSLLQRAGFEELEFWGDLQRGAPSLESRSFFCLARRAQKSEPQIQPASLQEIEKIWRARWGLPIFTLEGSYLPKDVEGLLLKSPSGESLALITWVRRGRQAEVVTLDALEAGRGWGSKIMEAAEQQLRGEGVCWLSLLTSNDNARALGFYLRRGYRLIQLHLGTLKRLRLEKPRIPKYGVDGIALDDLWSLEKQLF